MSDSDQPTPATKRTDTSSASSGVVHAETPPATPVLLVKPPNQSATGLTRPVGTEPLLEHPELAVELLKQQIDVGYRLVTFYTACVTAYVAMVGIAAQYFFAAMTTNRQVATLIASFGLTLSLFSLISPFGLEASRKEIAARVQRYSGLLGLPEERFTIVRVGTWLSLPLFLAIACVWIVLLIHASV
jgi:hypothetical protein